jgi:hypothetical protein
MVMVEAMVVVIMTAMVVPVVMSLIEFVEIVGFR